ncbi:tenascin-X [Stigmatella sp. ncwal1]|uniref:Tenascin-X n=1 Tax=Stigmatella ashevillensis TaxID=2995309 RepID=A0ABT5DBW5_9BACT|nr:tenascin-X [Stigmatella ashevillena]MDC0710544.1 tenascin-X [Stigmatella ashevillena]
MKSRLWGLVAGVSVALLFACGDVSDDAGVSDTARSESELNECPCGPPSGPMCEPCFSICGDHFCDSAHGENSSNCPEDCAPAPFCGDGSCNNGETSATCPSDCSPSTWCGDGACNGGETAASCPVDCGSSTCGNGVCSPREQVSCPSDCPPACPWCPQEPIDTKG